MTIVDELTRAMQPPNGIWHITILVSLSERWNIIFPSLAQAIHIKQHVV
jgi:hypothetical protein